MTLWQEGDEQVFDFFYKTHLMLLSRIAYNKTGEREVAEELVQDTFINLYRHKMSLDPNTSIKAYLYVILKNKITDFYRQEAIHQRYADYIVNHTSSQTISPLAYVETRELEQILKDAINKLPPQCQKVFKLSREQYMSDKEIAAEMGISVKTVEQHKGKALRLLRSALGGTFEFAVLAFLLGK
ncbi:MAG: RNA polymerase sigma-70 factor [Mucilaginibacter sp.]